MKKKKETKEHLGPRKRKAERPQDREEGIEQDTRKAGARRRRNTRKEAAREGSPQGRRTEIKTNGAEQAEGENGRESERKSGKPTATGSGEKKEWGPAWIRAERENEDRGEHKTGFPEKRKPRNKKEGGAEKRREGRESTPKVKRGRARDGQKQVREPGRRRQGKRGGPKKFDN